MYLKKTLKITNYVIELSYVNNINIIRGQYSGVRKVGQKRWQMQFKSYDTVNVLPAILIIAG